MTEAQPASSPALHHELEFRACTTADEPAILALHRRGFGVPWSRAHWRWRGVDSQLGRLEAAGAFDSFGNCRALFMGTPIRCAWEGREHIVASSSNSLLDPELRRSLAGGRVFERTIKAYRQAYARGRVLFTYGCPAEAVTRVTVRLIRAEALCDVLALVNELGHLPDMPAGMQVAHAGLDDPGIAEHLERCRRAAPEGTIRDRSFLEWRFARHPLVHYELLAARDAGGAVRGLMVLRDGGWHPEILSLMEWLVLPGDDDAEQALLSAAVGLARQRNRIRLVTTFGAASPMLRQFQARHGFVVVPTAHQVVFTPFHDSIRRQHLLARWPIHMSDLEFL